MRSLSSLVALFLLSPTTLAQCGDDAFEENDSIGSAAALSPGSYPGLVITSSQSACGVDEDFYRFSVADGMVLRVDLSFDTQVGNIGLWIFDSIADFPNNWVARSTTLSNHEVISLPNHSGAQQTYYAWVNVVNAFDTNVYDMDVAVFPDPCIGLAGDAFEPNDDCASATLLPAGLYTDLLANTGDFDYYSILVPDGQALRATALFTHDWAANLGLRLLDNCGTFLGGSHSATDDETVLYPNSSGTTATYVVQVAISPGTDTCLDYDLLLELIPDPCVTLPEDPNEDNDDCQEPIRVAPGTYGGLATFLLDRDVFITKVPSGETLTVELLFSHEDGNIDLTMFREGLICTHVPEGSATSVTDNEIFQVTNTSGAPLDFLWELGIVVGTFHCNSYTMVVHVTGQTGNSFCDASDGALAACPCGNPGNPESGCDIAQGTGGFELSVAAQEDSPLNRATLVGNGYPVMSFPGVTVIRSTGLDASSPVVFGDGLRCIGTPVVRVGAALAVGGSSTQTVGHGAGAGSGTFYYQLWVRNTPSMFCTPDAFNLSNGRTIVW
jgi:hypothetical protein